MSKDRNKKRSSNEKSVNKLIYWQGLLISSNSFTKKFILLKNSIIVTLFKKCFDFCHYRRGSERLCWRKKILLEEENMSSFFFIFFIGFVETRRYLWRLLLKLVSKQLDTYLFCVFGFIWSINKVFVMQLDFRLKTT